jgi:hypothetical protein
MGAKSPISDKNLKILKNDCLRCQETAFGGALKQKKISIPG